jgi:transcriptional regulator with XRE-family HTH domain
MTIAPMHKTIDKILAELMKRDQLSQADLSRAADVGQPTISRILNPNGAKGIKEPTDKQVRPLADFFGVSTDQLRGYVPLPPAAVTQVPSVSTSSSAEAVRSMLQKHGRGLSEEARQKLLAAVDEQEVAPTPAVDVLRPGQVGDEVWIAHYDVRAAMGGGQLVQDYPEMLQDIRVSPKRLRELGVEFSEHFNLKMVTGWGQSMAPTIRHRDPILVDVSIRDFVGDGIYLFTWGDHLYIKRLQVQGPDHFKMISDNVNHPPEPIPRDETFIQARVLLVWNANPV